MRTLATLSPGTWARIKNINRQAPLYRRLLDMGFTPNTKVFVRKMAPLKDPMEVYIRGYELTLLKADAAYISVEVLNDVSGSNR